MPGKRKKVFGDSGFINTFDTSGLGGFCRSFTTLVFNCLYAKEEAVCASVCKLFMRVYRDRWDYLTRGCHFALDVTPAQLPIWFQECSYLNPCLDDYHRYMQMYLAQRRAVVLYEKARADKQHEEDCDYCWGEPPEVPTDDEYGVSP